MATTHRKKIAGRLSSILLCTGLILAGIMALHTGCTSQPVMQSSQDTVQILREVINYPPLRDSLLKSFKDQPMLILKSDLLPQEYRLTWHGKPVKFAAPDSIHTSPDLNRPPRFVVTFPALEIGNDTANVVFRFKNAGLVAKFALKRSGRDHWKVVGFDSWHI